MWYELRALLGPVVHVSRMPTKYAVAPQGYLSRLTTIQSDV
jgi:hypothetical protein